MTFLLTLLLLLSFFHTYHNAEYTDTWAVHIEGGEDVAQQLAEKHGFTYLGQIMPHYYHFKHKHVSKRSLYSSPSHQVSLQEESRVKWLEQQQIKRRVKRDVTTEGLFNDPKWPKMWYLNRGSHLDMNVIPAWLMGYRGQNVVVSILDDGIEKDHPDLSRNYDPDASYDVNSHDNDPQPRYDFTNENRHGTRCAGEVAAEANNQVCSVGVAPEARIGGVRMLDGDVTDAVEAQSLSLNPQHIHIYSASWGPDDDGKTVDGPAALAKIAFKDGIEKGRGGKGSIFVWASGNGGRDQDSCNCDGYTNSIYTLSISSATETGEIPWYSEACSSTLATTYSSGTGRDRQIITTDLRKGCTENHTGTSASAPLAAGICALALSANPNLTWRDMQHIVVMTAKPANLRASDWVTNGVGRNVSHSFGFGLMDASAMVEVARNWTTVPPQHKCVIRSHEEPRPISINGQVSVSLKSDGCASDLSSKVLYVEHVQAVITLSASRRGDIEVFLTSPQGTRSTLLAKRPRDGASDGLNEWAFLTTHSWGEVALGTWTLEVINSGNSGNSATLKDWSLVLLGTATDPTREQFQKHPISHTQEPEDTTSSTVKSVSSMETIDPSTLPVTTTTTTTTVATTTTTVATSTNSDPSTLPTTTTTITVATTTDPSTFSTNAPSKSNVGTSYAGGDSAGTSVQIGMSMEAVTVICRSYQYRLEELCLDQCPFAFYSSNVTNVINGSDGKPVTQLVAVCLPCSQGCAQCSPGQCDICKPGYVLSILMSEERVCKPKLAARSVLETFWNYNTLIIASCVCAVFLFVVIFTVLQCKDRECFKSKGHEYTSLCEDDETEMNAGEKSLNSSASGIQILNGHHPQSTAISLPESSSESDA